MSDWHIDREDVDNKDKPLPEGWTRVEANVALKPLPRDLWRPTIYQHQSKTTQLSTFWYYPFKMPEVDEFTPLVVPEQTRYLFCRTWKTSVWLHRKWGRNDYWDDMLDLELWDNLPVSMQKDSRIGQLWRHYAKQFVEETNPVTEADEYWALIDVVAISRSSFSGE
jgi:hypothetical protein